MKNEIKSYVKEVFNKTNVDDVEKITQIRDWMDVKYSCCKWNVVIYTSMFAVAESSITLEVDGRRLIIFGYNK